jgi:hypothetical protein
MPFTVTDTARAKLLVAIASITEFEAVACVGWSSGGHQTSVDANGNEVTSPLPPDWFVGFYDPARVPAESITTISGIPFVLGDGLDEKTLYFENGRFVVR